MTWPAPIRLLQPNLRLPDAEGLDVEALVADVDAAGANAILANAGGIIAWYPTKLDFQRPNPHLRQDYLGAVVAAAHRRGIRVLARLDITKGWADRRAAHPEWFRVGPDGNPVVVRELLETCFHGPYWQAFNFRLIDEILERYPVDGFFYNHYRYLTCYCERCRARFRDETGHEMPRRETLGDAATEALISFRLRALAAYTERVQAYVRARSPHAVVNWDYEMASDNPGYARDSGWGPSLTRLADVIVTIAFDRVTRPLPKWIYQSGEQASMGVSSYERPTVVLLTYSAIFGNRRHPQPPDQLARDLVQIAARGGAPGVQLPGTLDQDNPRALGALRDVYGFLRAHEDLYRQLRTDAPMALLYSARTAERYAPEDPTNRYLAHYRGAYEMLTHAHLPFDVIDEVALERAVARYRVLVLPNVACLSDAHARLLDTFVEGGGHLIATHETALYDERGAARDDFALRCLGRRFVKRRVMQGAYLRLGDKALFGPALADTAMIGLGFERPYGGFGPFVPQVDVDVPGGEAEILFTEAAAAPANGAAHAIEDLRLTAPVTNNVPEFSYVDGEIGTPGLTIQAHGAGTAALLPWAIGRMYHHYGLIESRWILARLAARALGALPFETTAPYAVEVVAGRAGNRRVFHFVSSAGVESKPMIEPLAIGPFSLTVPGPVRAARALRAGRDLALTRGGDRTRIDVPGVAAFEVVVVE